MLVKEEELMEAAPAGDSQPAADGGGGQSASGKELFVLSLAVILSLTRQAPWEEFGNAGSAVAGIETLGAKSPGLTLLYDELSAQQQQRQLQQQLQQQHQQQLVGNKAERISDWLAANPLAVRPGWRAFPTLLSPQPQQQLWSDQDAVALAFYQDSGKEPLLSVLPKPPSSSASAAACGSSGCSNGSQSPPSWLSGAEEQLDESALQIGAELDQLFDGSLLEQLWDDEEFGSLLDAGCDAFAEVGGELGDLEAGGAAAAAPAGAQAEAARRAFLNNHTYAQAPGNQPAAPGNGCQGVVKASDMRAGAHRNKDPLRLAAVGIRLPYDEIVDCSHQRFLAILQSHSRRQQLVLQQVRKRGKNRLAASKCRQKKSDRVDKLREQLQELGDRNSVLREQLLSAQADERRLRDKYTQLYLTVFNRLRDADNRQLDPRLHRLQHGVDGTVILVARE